MTPYNPANKIFLGYLKVEVGCWCLSENPTRTLAEYLRAWTLPKLGLEHPSSLSPCRFPGTPLITSNPEHSPVYPLVKHTRSENFTTSFTYMRKNDFSISSIPVATHLLHGTVKQAAQLTCLRTFTSSGEWQEQGLNHRIQSHPSSHSLEHFQLKAWVKDHSFAVSSVCSQIFHWMKTYAVTFRAGFFEGLLLYLSKFKWYLFNSKNFIWVWKSLIYLAQLYK